MKQKSLLKTMLLLCALIVGSSAWAAEEVYKTALFGSYYNSKGVSGYTDVSFDATNDGFKVNVANFNNNNNGWNYIKCGGRSGAYTGTIITDAAIDKAITKVVLTIDAITSSNVTSMTLYTSTDKSTWTSAGTFDKSTGSKTVTLSSPTDNLYYKIEIVCTKGSSNGLVTVSKVEYYYIPSDPGKTDPTLSFPEESYDATLGTSFTAPALTTDPTGLSVTYASTETTVATVNENTGAVTLVGAGQTTITASFAGNDSYNAATASYTLNVTDPAVNTSVAIDDTNLTNTNVFTGTAAGSLSATVKDNNEATISGATVTWSSSDEYVATIASDGAVTLVGEGTTTITASYTGVTGQYKPSSVEYELTVTNEDPNAITLWSEDFSLYSANDVPSGGTYNYSCGGSGTKIYEDNYAGGTAPELLVAKSSGSFTAVVPLNQASGYLKLTYKTNAKKLQVSTPTEGITIEGAEEDGSISYNSLGEHTVTFTDVTTSMTSITIVFTATSGDNVRLDDIVLKGSAQPVAVEAPTFSINSGTYYEAQSVELSCATDGATIYYTTNGDEPTSSSTPYTGAITVSETTTIKAIAIKGNDQSTVSSATYTITEKDDVVFNITDKSLAYGESYTITRGTSSGREVQTDGYVTVSSDNTNVVSVNGMTITANAVGTATITIATAEGNTYKAGSTTITVTVTAPEGLTIAPEVPSLFKENFNAATGTGPTEGADWSGNIASKDFAADNEGWTGTSPYSGNGCARLGTGSANGSATTPAIAFDGSITYNLTFKAGAWKGDGTTLTVSCDDVEAEIGGTESNSKEFTMSNNAWTTFNTTIKAAAGSKITFATNNKRFFLDDVVVTDPNARATFTISLNSSGYATYCSQYPLDFTNAEDYTAWYISNVVADDQITFSQITGSIKGGQGILLKGTADATITLTSANSENELSDNKFVGTLAPTYIASGEYFGLKGNTFVPVNAGTVPVGKALLPVSAVDGTDSRLTFVFEDASGISTITREPITNNRYYNLSGQRVDSPKSGLYIVNGKKVMVK